MALPLDDPDYELVWPADVFRDEFKALLAASDGRALELLFREAFAGTDLADQLIRDRSEDDVPWGDPLKTARELQSRLDEVREQRQPKPYYHQRSGTSSPAIARLDLAQPAFVRLIRQLDDSGYFDRSFDKDCVDAPRDNPSLMLEERLDLPDLWPLRPEGWTEEVFYSLIEVFHDFIARPRTVDRYHSWSDCGWHYASFATKPGRALYVARVNSILGRNGFNLRLAPDGEDAGRLVVATDDARDDLLERSIAAEGRDADDVRHAIRLFRARNTTRVEKRSAVVALAGVLEKERGLLEEKLLSKDEGALFLIANKFAIRHQNASQQPDYDDAYLDWIFWWYLATVELVRSLRNRESDQP